MEENKHIQKTLTPIILEKGMIGYETVRDIEEKLNDPEVFNIAITGPYGSGKSTVLKSLMAQFPDKHKYLTISLASLTGNNENDGALDDREQQKIEYSLLQQLIYKEKPETLPDSRFRRIEGKSITSAICFGIGIIAFIISFFVVFEPHWMRVESLCALFDLGRSWNLACDILGAAYMLFCVFKVAAYSFRHSSFRRIRALNVKDVKIELNQDSSVFNKHLEEIVYFFESTDYSVVIIEDLDRFRCTEIFQKLREINFLLRQSEVLKIQNRVVKFIYAIKDDLFKDAERTKFFDYIATVIPVVNPKNSCEKLTQELGQRGYTLDKDALRDLSEFVDDMRMLKNVANEFQQYMERLSHSSSPNKEKLLAMIIYKNHHPDDFGKLHYKDGKVYGFIKRKPEWIKIAIDKVVAPRLEMWQRKKEDVINSNKFTLKQWRILYMEKYREHLTPALTHINIHEAWHSVKEIIDRPELFETLIASKSVFYRYLDYGRPNSSSANIDFEGIENEVDDKIGYMKRKDLAATSTVEIDKEIRIVRDEESRLKNYKLAKLLIQFPEIKENGAFIEIGLSELMIHFLQRGYIDETYYDYLTLYDGTIMSLNDRDLLSRIRQNDPIVTYDEQIDDIDAFMKDLPSFVCEYKSVLNYQIADYLESHPGTFKTSLDNFEQHFLNASTTPLDFLANYYRRGSDGAILLWRKYVKGDLSWQRIQTYERQEYWDTLVEAWLRYCEKGDMSIVIREWLNNNLGFCIERLDAIGVEHLKELIDGCQFVDLSSIGPVGGVYPGDDVLNLGNFIIEHRMFELTRANICTACIITSNPFSEDVREDNLTMSAILRSENKGLREYVKDNIEEVFMSCFVESVGQEDENGLLGIINEDSLNEEQKISYLLKQKSNKIVEISKVEEQYKPIAIRAKVLLPSWANAMTYYESCDEEVTDDLRTFIEDNATQLKDDAYPNGKDSSFASALIYGPYLKIEVYKELLPHLIKNVKPEDEELFSKETGNERAEALVQGRYLSSNVETAKSVSLFGPKLYAEYLSNNMTDFILHFKDYKQDAKALAFLLSKGSSLSNSQRWSLAKLVPESLVNTDADLSNSLTDVMLYRKEELSWPIVSAVLKRANPTDSKMKFQEWLLKNNKGDVSKVTTILGTMTTRYAEIIDEARRPLVPKGFRVYLDMIQPLGLFTSYKEEKNGLRVYHSTK